MKIVVLDGKSLNPGDLNWNAFAKLGELTVYESSPRETVLERSEGAGALITNKTLLREEHFAKLPQLRYIGILATGTNVVDIPAAIKRNITVCNVPKYSTDSVVQCTFAHLLNLTFHLGEHHNAVRDGEWCRCKDFCFWNAPLVELAGKTFGIVGYGEIGKGVATIARAFGMNVVAFGPRLPRDGSTDEWGTRRVSMEMLLAESDVVSLHCPLTDRNREMVDAAFLAKMKPTAFLLNTARGGLIRETDLVTALNEGRLAGAGVDVLSKEPPSPDNPLLSAKNCFITPHLAWGTHAARERLMKIAAENLESFLQGKPQNIVS